MNQTISATRFSKILAVDPLGTEGSMLFNMADVVNSSM